MKALRVLIVVLGFVVSANLLPQATAGQADSDEKKKEPEVTYQVDIEIRYNALSASGAAAVARDILSDHKTACDVKVTSSKNNNQYMVITGSSISGASGAIPISQFSD